MARALYVHIPFCQSICAYCDFPKVLYRQNWAESYLSALFAELDSYKIGKVGTIYVGGGTPSALPAPLLKRLLEKLSPFLEEGGEFTFEANPESLSEEKIALLAGKGVNRVSLGVESSLQKYLALMNRKHTFEEAREAVMNLRKAGISNINADWIYALPGETMEEVREEAKAFLSLGLPHLSAYTLILEDGSLFKAKGVKEASEDEQGEQYEAVLSLLREAGYERYEVSNFAKPGFQSRHNLTYWRDEEYYGIGLGASGYLHGIRYANTRSLSLYIKGKGLRENEEPSGEEEFLLSCLRLEEGFALSSFEKRFNKDFLFAYGASFKKMEKEGLLIVEDGRIKPTDRGIECLDYVLLCLLS